MKTKNVAKTVVLNSEGQVLLLRRSATDARRPGEWDFPGGGVDEHEDFAAAAARELAEEAGITVAPADLTLIYAATQPWEPTGESVNRFLFVARIDSAVQVQLSFEHDEHKWVDIDTALGDFPHPFYSAGLRYGRDRDLLGQR